MTCEQEEKEIDPIKAAEAALGRKGGLIGCKARAKALTKKDRSMIVSIEDICMLADIEASKKRGNYRKKNLV